MLLLQSAVVVIRTHKRDTTIVDELKQIYDVIFNHQNSDELSEIQIEHRLQYTSTITDNTNENIEVFVDGKQCLEINDKLKNNLGHYSNRLVSRKCLHCDKPNHMTDILPLPAKKPTIVIHINNKTQVFTSLVDELEECLNVLVFLKQPPVPKPIENLIITKTILPGILSSTIKIVGDGQVLYNGDQIWDKFYFQEQDLCTNCDLFGLDWFKSK